MPKMQNMMVGAVLIMHHVQNFISSFSVVANGYLLEGLTILRNRGYDSAGVSIENLLTLYLRDMPLI